MPFEDKEHRVWIRQDGTRFVIPPEPPGLFLVEEPTWMQRGFQKLVAAIRRKLAARS
jgi:hypothetical protein